MKSRDCDDACSASLFWNARADAFVSNRPGRGQSPSSSGAAAHLAAGIGLRPSITNESGELLAGEFYTRKLAEMGSYIALPEQHRVRLSDLKGELFISIGSQQVPGWDRRVEAYCKKCGKFRPKFYGPVQSVAQAFELITNENAVHILPAFVASHYSPPGVVILPLADADVTWRIVVMWRRGRTGGALKALLDALFTKVSPKDNEAKRQD